MPCVARWFDVMCQNSIVVFSCPFMSSCLDHHSVEQGFPAHSLRARLSTGMKPVDEDNSLVVCRKSSKQADIRRCRSCHNLRAAVCRLQVKHGDLVRDITKVEGDKVTAFYAANGDLRGEAWRSKVEEVVTQWKT